MSLRTGRQPWGFLVIVATACNGAPHNLTDTSATAPTSTSTPATTGTTAPSPPPTTSDAGDAGGGSGGSADAGAAPDALPPAVDAAMMDAKPGPPDMACESPLAWWATNAAFDPAVMGATFASNVSPLVAAAHPITIADTVDANQSWTLRASGTSTNGNYQQYFPFDHAADAVPMQRAPASFSSASPASTSWMVIADAANATVWVPLSEAVVSATYADSYCQQLTGGTLTAVVPSSAGSTSLATAQGQTTLAILLGDHTSQQPEGWMLRMTFDGTKVEVASK
jgi:hypothetical protein